MGKGKYRAFRKLRRLELAEIEEREVRIGYLETRDRRIRENFRRGNIEAARP